MSEKIDEMIKGVRIAQLDLKDAFRKLDNAKIDLEFLEKELASKQDRLGLAEAALMAAIEQDVHFR